MLKRKSPLRYKPWEKKEDSDARDFGGQRVKGSGNKWWRPGDVKSGLFLIDAKTTKHASFSITEQIWEKLTREAIHSGKLPALSVQTSAESGSGIEVVVVNKQDLLAMLEELDTLRGTQNG